MEDRQRRSIRIANVFKCYGVLNVTVRGIFDLCNNERVPKKPVTAATTSTMAGFDNGVGIGQVKKLKLVARRYQSRGVWASAATSI
uniref:Uncharacterized protein n=1 Tax=Phytophthora fragariae TaxID=53985 RepID=A0A6A3EWB3_9STRA|nr:hypothetical protein PF009_g15734 [Phytophthora fragariae]